MARNKPTSFELDAGLYTKPASAPPVAAPASGPSDNPAQPENSGEAVRPAFTASSLASLYSPSPEVGRPLGVTQGRKGQKAKRITMTFSDDNHAYLTYESRRRGLSITQFVNTIIDLYKATPEGHVD